MRGAGAAAVDGDTRQLTTNVARAYNPRMSGLRVSNGIIEASAIIDYVREHADQPQMLMIRATTGEAVTLAAHYCNRSTTRQIIDRHVRRPLYDALMNMGPHITIAMEGPLLGWDDGNMPEPSASLRSGTNVTHAYRTYIERYCGYQAAEEHLDLIRRLSVCSVDAEALERRLEYLDLFRDHPSVRQLLARTHDFHFGFPAETDQEEAN